MFNTPKGDRPHLTILGQRNAGKSSFFNAFIGQDFCIISEIPGTTTDPVEKAYELQPIGPILLIDTAGIDDTGELGAKRIEKTNAVIKRTDYAILLIDKLKIDKYEEQIIELLSIQNIPWILIVNEKSKFTENEITKFAEDMKEAYNVHTMFCSAKSGQGMNEIKKYIASEIDSILPGPPIIADLVNDQKPVVLVVPIDKAAPKGRIILPQVQTIRELLDAGIPSITVRESELDYCLKNIINGNPALVVTDSQAFELVSKIVPENIPLTSFSILFARHKGDIHTLIQGVYAIENLKENDSILIAESCSHSPVTEDIGRVKLPNWIQKYKGIKLNIDVKAGKDYPADLTKYKLIIQCGGCVVNRKLILSRINQAKKQGVPITNYGVTISYLNGILKRATTPLNL